MTKQDIQKFVSWGLILALIFTLWQHIPKKTNRVLNQPKIEIKDTLFVKMYQIHYGHHYKIGGFVNDKPIVIYLVGSDYEIIQIKKQVWKKKH